MSRTVDWSRSSFLHEQEIWYSVLPADRLWGPSCTGTLPERLTKCWRQQWVQLCCTNTVGHTLYKSRWPWLQLRLQREAKTRENENSVSPQSHTRDTRHVKWHKPTIWLYNAAGTGHWPTMSLCWCNYIIKHETTRKVTVRATKAKWNMESNILVFWGWNRAVW